MNLKFDADLDGIGDAIMRARVASNAEFYATGDRKVLLTMMGRKVVDTPGGDLRNERLGFEPTLYGYEKEVTKGLEQRADVWHRRLEPWGAIREEPSFEYRPEDVESVKKAIGLEPPPIMLFPGSAYRSRMWPDSHWLDLAWTLSGRLGYRVWWMFDKEESLDRLFPGRNMPGLFLWGHSLSWVATAMSMARGTIGVDSGPVHMATVAKCPAIAIMGPTKNVFAPEQVTEMACSKETLQCVGCYFNGIRPACDIQCRALALLMPEEVVAQVVRQMPAGKWLWPHMADRRGVIEANMVEPHLKGDSRIREVGGHGLIMRAAVLSGRFKTGFAQTSQPDATLTEGGPWRTGAVVPKCKVCQNPDTVVDWSGGPDVPGARMIRLNPLRVYDVEPVDEDLRDE